VGAVGVGEDAEAYDFGDGVGLEELLVIFFQIPLFDKPLDGFFVSGFKDDEF